MIAWAVAATALLLRNPLPFPDKGHRLFAVPNAAAQIVVLQLLSHAGVSLKYQFRTGPTVQSLLWDNTVVHLVDQDIAGRTGLTGSGISLPVPDPQRAAEEAIHALKSAGFDAECVGGFDDFLPPNHLTVVRSTAFVDWALVFRRHLLKMPKPQFINSGD